LVLQKQHQVIVVQAVISRISRARAIQGNSPNTLLGIPYPVGSVVDIVASAFGGSHDRWNKPIWYDKEGNVKKLEGGNEKAGEAVSAAPI
jgi:hypothetical protein